MCRSIRVLHHFEPPTTDEEIQAAALQYVRKVSGRNKPTKADREVFDRAVDAIAKTTKALLAALPPTGVARTREGERDKARRRWQQREARQAR